MLIQLNHRAIMEMLTLNEILKATGGKVIRSGSSSFNGISIDSRKIGEGELFVALKGDRFDGHDFLRAALEKGGGALVSKQPVETVEGKTYIYVPDTLKALQDIARSRRLKKDIPVVAVTGSNGKTTTKELTAAISRQKIQGAEKYRESEQPYRASFEPGEDGG